MMFFSSEFIRMTFSKGFLQSSNTKSSVYVIIIFECIYFMTIFIFFIWFYNENKKNAISIQFLFKFITLLEIIHFKSGLIHSLFLYSAFCFLLSAFILSIGFFSIPSFLFLICNFLFDSFYSLYITCLQQKIPAEKLMLTERFKILKTIYYHWINPWFVSRYNEFSLWSYLILLYSLCNHILTSSYNQSFLYFRVHLIVKE